MKKIIAHSSNYTKGRKGKIEYIVVHYTANNGDTAKGNCNYFAGENRNASAHYFVDSNEVCQSVEDSDTAWHCGAKVYYHKKCRNDNSIGVELCSHRDSKGAYYFDEATVNNGVEFVNTLMEQYKVPIQNVLRHYDVTHKVCPAPFVNDIKQWNAFKNKLGGENMKIETYEEAVERLVKEGVINSREYWDNAVKCVKYLDSLIINMANKL